MRFNTLELALRAQRAVAPLIARIQRHDRKLAQQMKDATNSYLLNLGEGAYSDPGTRRSRYQNAAGSTGEVLVGLRGAIGWGYLRDEDVQPAAVELDRLLGALWKLTH